MQIYLDNLPMYDIQPRYQGQTISVAIDSSKTNSAIAIGNEQCVFREVIEFNGKFDGTSQEETLILAKKQRDTLKVLLSGAKVKYCGIENIITKDKESKEHGMQYHMSRFKITAIFMSFISYFQDNHGITPELVNNQTWKSVVLPKEFNTKDIGKGSLLYFKSIESPFAFYTDDATDAICILEYMRIVKKLSNIMIIDKPQLPKREFVYGIYRQDVSIDKQDVAEFRINESLPLQANLAVMINNIAGKKYAIAEVNVNYFSVQELYENCYGTFPEYTEKVLLVAKEKRK